MLLFASLSLPACSCATTDLPDAGRDAPIPSDAPIDVMTDWALDVPPDVPADAGRDVGTDARASCLDEGHEAGDRYPAGDPWDGCNYCECLFDGATICTDRVCPDSIGGCTYEGRAYDYGERFPSEDGCNECVCAASGLACTVRDGCAEVPSSAILLESMNDSCGADDTFTPAMVLGTLPTTDFVAPFLYDRDRTPAEGGYPEVLPDTNVRLRIVFEEDFFMVCRLPSPEQPALDIQVVLEWITADGAFDEGLPAYLRRNDFGFLDTWEMAASVPLGGLNGTYTPICSLDPGDYSFGASVEPDGHATGTVYRVCETDLPLMIGGFDRPAP